MREYMVETITYKGKQYPKFQSEGYASRFAIPYAQQVCHGVGVDVGCNREEWAFPGSTPIDPVINEWDAMNFPQTNLDYIFSSHCLEHLTDWVSVLDYWKTKLNPGGVLFLYLPDYSQVYWRPWNNRKHLNIFTPHIIRDYMEDRGYKNVFTSGVDLYNAFMVFGENA
jgi:predicted SAM-dependent methyltransferase